jgi:starch synthase
MAKRFTWDEAAAKYERLYLEGMRIRLGAERVRQAAQERRVAAVTAAQ